MKIFLKPEPIIELLAAKPSRRIVARVGMRTNGDLHLGNLFPLLEAFFIGERLSAKGLDYKLLIFLVDQEIDGKQLPFNLRDEKGAFIADKSISAIKEFISGLPANKIEIEFIKVSDTIQQKDFKENLLKIGAKVRFGMQFVCPKHHLNIPNKPDYSLSGFFCPDCQKSYKYQEVKLLLDHDLLGALENRLYPIDLHVLGSDHLEKIDGVTRMESRSLYQEIIGVGDYLTLLTPMVLYKDKKMSKSEKYGIFLNDLKDRFGEDYIAKITDFVSKKASENEVNIDSINCLGSGPR